MIKLGKKGFTLIEAIASIFIVTLVLTTAISIIVNIRRQTFATNERIVAIEVASRIRDNVINETNYNELSIWQNGLLQTVDSSNCSLLDPPFSCDLFTYTANGKTYDTSVSIVFYAPTAESITYEVVHFSVFINYFADRSIESTGIVYE